MNRYPPGIHGLEVEHWIYSDSTSITWNPNVTDSSEVIVEIISLFLNESMVKSHSCLATFENIPNTGQHNLRIDRDVIDSPLK